MSVPHFNIVDINSAYQANTQRGIPVDNKDEAEALRKLVRYMPNAVALFDQHHQLLTCSERYLNWAELLGNGNIPSSSRCTQGAKQRYVLSERIQHELNEALNSDSINSRIIAFNAGGRDACWLEMECRLLSMSNDQIDGVLITLHDVSAPYRVEQELRLVNDELSQFNYHVSHDLVAPISSARGLLYLIKDDFQENELEEIPELLTEAEAQLVRLDSLVVDLMSLARADVQEGTNSTFDLRELIDDIVASISMHARELEVSVTVNANEPNVHTDRVRIQQILTNLISNARKFVDHNELAPEIVVSKVETEQTITIQVADNGIGIEENLVENVFNIFTRGSTGHAGHGLGLYIVQKHAARLGGQVQLKRNSKPTVFEVTIPKTGLEKNAELTVIDGDQA